MIKQEVVDSKNAPRLAGRPDGPRLPIKNASKELGIFALLVVLCIFVTVMSGGTFLHADNLQNTSRLIGLYGIFSIGLGVVIITGGIDLSVGSLFALLGVLLAMMLTEWHWPWPVAVLTILAGGALIGLFHGFLITKINLQPFVVTLCGLLAYRGLARIVSGDGTKGFGDSTGFEKLQAFATGNVLGMPTPFFLLIITAIIMGVVLHRSVYGRYLYAVGRNEEAARYSGVNTQRIIVGAYVISGLLAALSAILLAFYTNSISPSSHGQAYELYGIAAAVLGGCSLRGGEGSIIGILLGTALLQVLRNLVNLVTINGHAIPSSSETVVVGVVILLGVAVDELIKRRNATKVK
jgi:ribose transport system permease protein